MPGLIRVLVVTSEDVTVIGGLGVCRELEFDAGELPARVPVDVSPERPRRCCSLMGEDLLIGERCCEDGELVYAPSRNSEAAAPFQKWATEMRFVFVA